MVLGWLKKQALRVALKLAKKQAAAIAIALLAQVDPNQLADTVRPHIQKLFDKSGPEWQAAFTEALGKIGEFVRSLREGT